ncbi:MAG: SDR family NAD(P)-dependent oxidoreductase [Dehalococcoidia bacterium]|nr:SDR family NAD(P)-dependent oxidoreductase [Thermoflexaceae bacterium]
MGNSLEGRVAIVTGAGRGIGRSTAILLAKEGAAVVVNDLGGQVDGTGADAGPAQSVVDEIKAAGGKAVANTDSVAGYDSAENIIRTALNEFGRLDVLVNVAGNLRDRMIFNMTEEEWDSVMDVHAKGTFNTTKFASIYWRQAREGHYRLVNFTSGSGLFGAPGQPNYAAAKMAIVGLTYSVANSMNRYGVTANAIAPGAATRMTATVPTERRRAGFPADDDAERSPDNVAVPIAYIARKDTDWLNGWVIGASGYQVTLYSNPEPIRQLVAPQRWDIDALGQAMESTFKAEAMSGSMFQRREAAAAPPPQG